MAALKNPKKSDENKNVSIDISPVQLKIFSGSVERGNRIIYFIVQKKKKKNCPYVQKCVGILQIPYLFIRLIFNFGLQVVDLFFGRFCYISPHTGAVRDHKQITMVRWETVGFIDLQSCPVGRQMRFITAAVTRSVKSRYRSYRRIYYFVVHLFPIRLREFFSFF